MSGVVKRKMIWAGLAIVSLFALIASGNLVKDKGDAGPEVDTPIPVSTATPVAMVTVVATVDEPTATATVQDVEFTPVKATYDRPDWLKRVTSGWNTKSDHRKLVATVHW